MAAFVITNCLPTLRHMLRWKPDLVHAHFAVPTGVIAWLMRVLTGRPYVLTVHLGDVPGGMPETDNIFRVIKPLTIPIWKGAACITAVSESVRQLALAAYALKVLNIPNGIELESLTPSPEAPGSPPRLVFAGRFTAQKNPLLIVEALQHLKDLSWELDMLGDGPLLPAVTEGVKAYGLEGRVRLHGWVSDVEVSRVMQGSDILLIPSRSEGLPIVGIKALAHGLAVLGSDIAGLKDIRVDGVNGVACAAGDRDSFARALKSLLGNPEKLMAMKQASRRLAPRFDLTRIAARYEEIFLDVSSRHENRLPSLHPW
jgi:glycosyltransferase involved in cell wall biosynthesis